MIIMLVIKMHLQQDVRALEVAVLHPFLMEVLHSKRHIEDKSLS